MQMAALLHLHCPLHPFLHSQHNSSRHAWMVSGSVVHWTLAPMSFLFHPQSQRWVFWNCNHHLSPTNAGLVGSSLRVLNQCCWCWKKSINEYVLAGLIKWYAATCTIMQQYHESLQKFDPVIYRIWSDCQSTKGSSNIIKCHACHPCCVLTLAKEEWHCITPCTSIWTWRPCNHMSG